MIRTITEWSMDSGKASRIILGHTGGEQSQMHLYISGEQSQTQAGKVVG